MDTSVTPSRVPLTRMRRAVARSMSVSATIPQFTVEVDAHLGPLAALRARVKERGGQLSYSDAMTAACAQTLVEHPNLNASYADDGILVHPDINIGIAISVEEGLVAPAIRNADRLGLGEIAAERVRLTLAAAEGNLTPQDLLTGTFSISNLGPLHIRRFRALIVPPQAAILAVGAVTSDLRCSMSLSCDHRVLDGVPGALFLTAVVARLAEPAWLERLLP